MGYFEIKKFPNKDDERRRNRILLGVIIGSSISIVLIVLLILFLVKHENANNKKNYSFEYNNTSIKLETTIVDKTLSLESVSDDDLFDVKLNISTDAFFAYLGTYNLNDFLYKADNLTDNTKIEITFVVFNKANNTYVTSFSDVNYQIYEGIGAPILIHENRYHYSDGDKSYVSINKDGELVINSLKLSFKI